MNVVVADSSPLNDLVLIGSIDILQGLFNTILVPERTLSEAGALWCTVVYSDAMSSMAKRVRQSVSLPARVARRVKVLAQTTNTSTSRVIVGLIESGLDAREQEKARFFEYADRLSRSRDPEEQARLKEELARMTFGG